MMRISNTFIILYGIICTQAFAVLLSGNELKPKGIRITPTPLLIGSKATLHCDYELGDATLYYVKWYQGRNEFYRYEPHIVPRQKVFIQNGINVNLDESDAHKVVLQAISKLTDDQYSCEVATEAPSFLTFHLSIHMNVTDKGDTSENDDVTGLTTARKFQLVGIRISPTPVVVGAKTSLHCDYEVGSETLYAVKWYKGKWEFYRFVPASVPNKQIFPIRGLDVNVQESDAKKVVLQFVSESNSDNYTCEIITDAPSFFAEMRSIRMDVLAKKNTSFNDDINELTTEQRFQLKGIRITPKPVIVGAKTSLHCDYELGSETLYSVKWYKDTREFYRFMTARVPNKLIILIPGLDVNGQESDAKKVVLKSVSESNSDNYTCEVTTDAPTFSMTMRTIRMDVLGATNLSDNTAANTPAKRNRFRVKGIRVSPAPVVVGVTTSLYCDYELGDEPLYSIKWYKSSREFYRFVPSSILQQKIFPLPGINVNLIESDDKKVVLQSVYKSNNDNYTCEVTTDAPNFNSEVQSIHLDVVDEAPIITLTSDNSI